VIVLEAQDAVTPAGSPVAVPIPVAPVVVCVMLVNAVLIHSVGVEEATLAVFNADTDTDLVLLELEHPTVPETV